MSKQQRQEMMREEALASLQAENKALRKVANRRKSE
jgi:hypothetical protein